MMRFYDKEKNKNTLGLLTNALANRNKTTINVGGINQPVRQQQAQDDNTWQGAGQLLKGGASLYNGIKGFKGNSNSGTGLFSSAINDYINGAETPSSPISSAINSNGGGSALTNAINSEAGGLSGINGLGLVGPVLGGINGLAKSGDYKDGLQGIFGVDSENDSDVMQGIKGVGNGALTGLSVGGPVGAAIGALLGLGSSFLDDI